MVSIGWVTARTGARLKAEVRPRGRGGGGGRGGSRVQGPGAELRLHVGDEERRSNAMSFISELSL